MMRGVSIIIPTYNGGELFAQALSVIGSQKIGFDVQLITIDSGSTDETLSLARTAGATVIEIPNGDFHHARTRQQALAQVAYEAVVFTVQDAIPASLFWLSDLVSYLDMGDFAAVYGQQVPHADADCYARFETVTHAEHLGQLPLIQALSAMDTSDALKRIPFHEALRITRLDNVCAIYRTKLLRRYPFPEVAFGEDMAWASTILANGYQIFYQPLIKVFHSHNRSSEYRFRRTIVDVISCYRILNKLEVDLSSLTVSEVSSIAQRFKARFLGTAPEEAGRATPFSLGVLTQMENDFQYLHNTIRERFYRSNEDEQDVIAQIVAVLLGRLYGLFYVSCLHRNKQNAAVEQLIAPYLHGV